jgi:hypothetical protein
MNLVHLSSFRLRRLLFLLLVVSGTRLFSAEASPATPAAVTYTEEQKTALKALDDEITRFDALIATVPDVQQRTAVKAFMDGFKDRRVAIRRAYDHETYNELRWEINVEYQRLVAWLAAPTITIRAARAEAVAEPRADLLNPSPANPAEVNAALGVLDRQLRQLDEQVAARPAGPARQEEFLRLQDLHDGRRELGRNFTPARWDALVGALKTWREKNRSDVAQAAGPSSAR